MACAVIAAIVLLPVARVFCRRLRGGAQSDATESQTKPQTRFKYTLVSNDDAPFRHANGTYGPSARHPFEEDMLRSYQQPFPIDVLRRFSESPTHVGYKWVNTLAALREVVVKLASAKAVAVDVEHNHTRSYLGLICLVQLSDGASDWLIDAIAMHDYMHMLAPIFCDEQILKVMHGAESDVLWLQRDFHIYCVNVFDTARASQGVTGGDAQSLATLLCDLCGVHSDKSWQLYDWRIRPLPEPALDYAMTDVHYLLHIAALLAEQLQNPTLKDTVPLERLGSPHRAKGRKHPVTHRHETSVVGTQGLSDSDSNTRSSHSAASPQLLQVTAKSRRVTERLFSKPRHEAAALAAAHAVVRHRLIVRQHHKPREMEADVNGTFATSSVSIGTAGRDRIYGLCLWRDSTARELDEGTQFVMSDSAVCQLALQRPHDVSTVVKVVSEADVSTAGRACLTADDIQRVLDVLRDADRGRITWPPEHQHVGQSDSKNPGSETSPAAAEKLRWKQLSVVERRRLMQERLVRKFAAKEPVYDNCRMLSKGGELLCYCDRQKVNWYLDHHLADVEPTEEGGPTVIRLRFEHQNNDQRAGMQHFYVERKANQCVGCGDSTHYLRYRVIPACYRRHFPEALKSHRSHDIVLLCLRCHELAHTAADRTKLQVVRDFGIPLLPPDDVASATIEGEPLSVRGADGTSSGSSQGFTGTAVPNAATVRGAAGALLKHRHSMPIERRRKVESVVSAYVGVPLPARGHLSDEALTAGIQAGLTRKSRLKALRRLPPEMKGVTEAIVDAEADRAPGGTGASVRFGAAGHLWHGHQVVKAAQARGGTMELIALGRRFRASFMQAVQPRYLTSAWDVEHDAMRNFGEHSIFTADKQMTASSSCS